MTDRLIPATLELRENGALVSSVHGALQPAATETYAAPAQAGSGFLHGNGLPERWRGRRSFTIVETGFGAGWRFLATWAAWRADPARSERLHYVAIEAHPFSRDDLRRAAERMVANATTMTSEFERLIDALAGAWPILAPGLHRLEFDAGGVILTLAFGDPDAMLSSLVLRADAFHLDTFAVRNNRGGNADAACRALAKLADEDATFAIDTIDDAMRKALQNAGFSYREEHRAGIFAPRWKVRRHEPPRACDVAARDAIVIGAGLAGSALAERLTARGWRVTLIERRDDVAGEASGNPAGVFHPLVAIDDNFGARLSRAGYLYALSRWRAFEAAGHDFARSANGLLQLACNDDEFERMQAAAAALGMPETLAVLLTRDQAAERLHTATAHGGWFFPHGGSLDPAALASAACAMAGERLTRLHGVAVAQLVPRDGGGWRAVDAAGKTLAEASVAIVANAADAPRVAQLRHAPVQIVRGQLTVLPAGVAPAVALPAIGDGYLIPFADGTALTGATYDPDDADPALRASGHRENLARLAALLPCSNIDTAAMADPATLAGRVAFRCVASDRLPMAGELGDEAEAAARAAALSGAQARDVPRAAGLYGAFGFGSRGFIWAALCAELIASQLDGEPWPIERELAEAIDPARFLLRALRQGRAG
ncbi:bifunctional tRNA (5-methylaminomethyl-2-thiouridine)(34)-methyltransferase MnmD/FAD-dependent 5-carboxymethylaminomethyl-2-thiouridine(34) oxidoreductase MnmC [Burkholderia sp. Ac-20379]|uniref:bifunctional tRNA (5-methylaminomethyl-2-thiouridine)(34)-methyltransferase MnmD/FAD-dependent 5-carboxymethylaminomethyl-2-thiouridine(34) oxidoreductase MnmC n=1 Tax=Burkholderia sp. Ac-20379 TaxID=2703900 RepID=UPI00197DDDDC|nr:bifunctional tRNA (5-methylaminomethyl-2-thiouridine)(34)-methyltransferase MnmD/FAD-dependent 5-carboxymethylaminomethyl-2-thiouridine(34) oxidoreductase MnmC [Burkholderia sp. Ac-20379]MBN3722907.1 bifunctional tRNA (5-methylaminomethyl-2-thiouridine)(34)-methyltransferase MnmD/FAD-dependent 5-carboxymethylaminomethyl-2-thiouridine(34) oxidoreductase MnmC [Burkholderia sp. Ac-20379]